MSKKQIILITGITGFLGKQLYNSLKNNYQIYGISRTSIDNNIHKVDLTKLSQIRSFITKIQPDIIFHLAAYVNLSRDYITALKGIDLNYKATLNLLEATTKTKIKKIIFTSTEEVYGNGKIPFKESQRVLPPSPYSISKAACEDLIRLYSSNYGYQSFILRLATFYGPGNHPDRFISHIIKSAKTNKSISLNSETNKRDYIYIDDVIKALKACLSVQYKSTSEIINIGGGKSYSLRELTDLILNKSKSSSQIKFGMFPDRINEISEWKMNIDKAWGLLKWKPEVSLEKGIEKTIRNS